MKKMLLIILGFFCTGGSIASCDFLGKKKEHRKEHQQCSSKYKTCDNLPSYPSRCERRW